MFPCCAETRCVAPSCGNPRQPYIQRHDNAAPPPIIRAADARCTGHGHGRVYALAIRAHRAGRRRVCRRLPRRRVGARGRCTRCGLVTSRPAGRGLATWYHVVHRLHGDRRRTGADAVRGRATRSATWRRCERASSRCCSATTWRAAQVDLGKTLADMGMDDVGGLTRPREAGDDASPDPARSGVYHPASNAGDDLASAPPRGSQAPGTYFLYNNWDFNALGAAFEQQTGADIYDALDTRTRAADRACRTSIARAHRKTGDANASRNLAYHMNLSTRDMARIGYLMLREGNWNGRQIVPRDWVRESTQRVHACRRDESRAAQGRAVGLRLSLVGVGRARCDRPLRGCLHGTWCGRATHHRATRSSISWSRTRPCRATDEVSRIRSTVRYSTSCCRRTAEARADRMT